MMEEKGLVAGLPAARCLLHWLRRVRSMLADAHQRLILEA